MKKLGVQEGGGYASRLVQIDVTLNAARAAVSRWRTDTKRSSNVYSDKWLNYQCGTLLSCLHSDSTRPGLLPVSKLLF